MSDYEKRYHSGFGIWMWHARGRKGIGTYFDFIEYSCTAD